MHQHIDIIRQALNAAQDEELKLSWTAIESLEKVNEYLFEVEESLQNLCVQVEQQESHIEELETELYEREVEVQAEGILQDLFVCIGEQDNRIEELESELIKRGVVAHG